MFSVIIAGGQGSRLWPLSTPERPKPLIGLPGGRNLLERTLDRALKLSPVRDTLLVITREVAEPIIRALPESFPRANILVEPEGKNTAPCIALAAHWVSKRQPDAVMAVFPADHCFLNEGHFIDCVREGASLSRTHGRLALLGLKPNRASSTEYGHILLGDRIPGTAVPAHFGTRFVEKPDTGLSAELIASGGARWNSGIYVGPASVFSELTRKHLPEVHEGIQRAGTAEPQLAGAYRAFPSISIDHAITQKLDSFIALDTAIERVDVGGFDSFGQLWEKDGDGNAVLGEMVGLQARGNIVFSKKTVALAGVEDLVVIDTPEALLICPRGNLGQIKALRDKVKKRKGKGETS